MARKQYPTIIHERVDLARRGENKTVFCRLRSGWVVLGDDQRLRGYSLLLADPIRDNLNDLNLKERSQFLLDMSVVGDALIEVFEPSIINYSILGNKDRALHAHIHPRYDYEEPDKRQTSPLIYRLQNMPKIAFDYKRDRPNMDKILNAIAKRTEIGKI
ncbi:MAG: hypothetical protein JSW07_21310 [bacterium]|nr:MAG: hypothetical protein JSW07_21310 [bacterium]